MIEQEKSADKASCQQQLPPLPYDFSALEPTISGEIMELHYLKHHQTYVNNLNKALEQYAEAEERGNLSQMIALQSAIRFNGGGHLNHSLFWSNLAPVSEGGGAPPKGSLAQAIDGQFGSLQRFIDEFNATSAAIQGSGWGWLVWSGKSHSLRIVTRQNQDPVSIEPELVALLGIDVWEHAYYLQYKNVRLDYLKAIWNVVHWKKVADRFESIQKA